MDRAAQRLQTAIGEPSQIPLREGVLYYSMVNGKSAGVMALSMLTPCQSASQPWMMACMLIKSNAWVISMDVFHLSFICAFFDAHIIASLWRGDEGELHHC